MNTYEFTFITTTDNKTTMSAVEKILSDNQADVTARDTWGKRTLAYPIKKQTEGFYHLWTVQISPKSILDVRRKLEHSEDVIRYLLLKRA
ncbi:MAG: 30S ribosomal protein S6 [Microgenomates bacterium OLB22]|nr:MAG: 30S ribosomal protein S6 [Microgenomates bacterium OLB22]